MGYTKNLFRYHVNSMVALNSRIKLQKKQVTPWEFHFPGDNGKAFVWDNIEVREIKLHAGLKIIVVLEGTCIYDIENDLTGIHQVFSSLHR